MSAARKADGDDEILSADGGLFLIVAALFVALVLAGGAAFMLLKKQPHKPRVMGASAGTAPDEPEQVEADDEISFDAKVDAAAAAIELEVVVDNPTQHELGIIVDDDDDDEPLPPMYGRASAPAASFDAKVDAAAAAAQKADGRASAPAASFEAKVEAAAAAARNADSFEAKVEAAAAAARNAGVDDAPGGTKVEINLEAELLNIQGVLQGEREA